MPRCKTQTIPPQFLDAYLKAFAPTQYDLHHYGTHPDARDLITRIRTSSPGATILPTSAQAYWQALFRDAAAIKPTLGPAEDAAYYQASIGTPLHYYNLFMQRTINAFHIGTPWETLARPDAIHFDLANGATCGGVEMYGYEGTDATIELDLETEPTTFNDCESLITNSVYQWLRAYRFAGAWNEYTGRMGVKRAEFGTPGRNRYTVTYTVPALSNFPMSTSFWRSGDEQTACILWKYTVNGNQPNLRLINFVQGAD